MTCRSHHLADCSGGMILVEEPSKQHPHGLYDHCGVCGERQRERREERPERPGRRDRTGEEMS